jgi:hypothetical protein
LSIRSHDIAITPDEAQSFPFGYLQALSLFAKLPARLSRFLPCAAMMQRSRLSGSRVADRVA